MPTLLQPVFALFGLNECFQSLMHLKPLYNLVGSSIAAAQKTKTKTNKQTKNKTESDIEFA